MQRFQCRQHLVLAEITYVGAHIIPFTTDDCVRRRIDQSDTTQHTGESPFSMLTTNLGDFMLNPSSLIF